jgi:hypothetical protein
MTALHTVHVRVNDAATGQPTPVRLRITDGAGTYYPPLGRLAQFATGRGQDVGGNLLLGAKQYAYIDGACEVPLPAGPIRVELWKGPEYRPQTVEVPLAAGKLALRLAVERWTNLREQGWFSGDTRAHYLSPAGALLEGAAEDLAVVNVLAFEDRIKDQDGSAVPALPNILDFSGQKPAAERPGHLVAVNTHNTHPTLGSLGLLNTHRVVYPLRFGGPDGADDWTLRDWCGQCHRKGGLVVWTKPGEETDGLWLGEALANVILGEVDACEVNRFSDNLPLVLDDWYGLLDQGFRLPLVGASAKENNSVPLGAMRTYARLTPGEPFSYRAWIEAVRAGRTFVTNGPLLSFTVNGQDPGAIIEVDSPDQRVHVRAEARSIVPFEGLVLTDGLVEIAGALASGSPSMAVLETEVPVGMSHWLAIHCWGGNCPPHLTDRQTVFARTSPVHVRVRGQCLSRDQEYMLGFLGHLDEVLKWVARDARCPTEKHRAALAEVFTTARAELQRRAT